MVKSFIWFCTLIGSNLKPESSNGNSLSGFPGGVKKEGRFDVLVSATRKNFEAVFFLYP